jgi:hypothetical protein
MIDRSTEQNKNTVDFPSAWLDTVDESRPDISALLKTASGTELGFGVYPVFCVFAKPCRRLEA